MQVDGVEEDEETKKPSSSLFVQKEKPVQEGVEKKINKFIKMGTIEDYEFDRKHETKTEVKEIDYKSFMSGLFAGKKTKED